MRQRWLGLFILVVLVAIIAMQISLRLGDFARQPRHQARAKPQAFWPSIAFEIVMAAVLPGGLIMIPNRNPEKAWAGTARRAALLARFGCLNSIMQEGGRT